MKSSVWPRTSMFVLEKRRILYFLKYLYIKFSEKEAQPCKRAMCKKKKARHRIPHLTKTQKAYFMMIIFRVAVKPSADNV